jgi:hypothetical protein
MTLPRNPRRSPSPVRSGCQCPSNTARQKSPSSPTHPYTIALDKPLPTEKEGTTFATPPRQTPLLHLSKWGRTTTMTIVTSRNHISHYESICPTAHVTTNITTTTSLTTKTTGTTPSIKHLNTRCRLRRQARRYRTYEACRRGTQYQLHHPQHSQGHWPCRADHFLPTISRITSTFHVP